MDVLRSALSAASDTRNTRWVIPLLLAADAGLTALVVWKVPYTEIDWKAYMQQISQYAAGERNYAKLYGDTGPLVYPAVHVYIYRALHFATSGGEDIALAQAIFAALYLATLTMVMLCYRHAGAPPYLLPLLVLSKRLHSIFVLRLFNDGIATFFLWATIYCYQRRMWTLGSFAFTLGVGVKMSILLALPAVGVLLWQAVGLDKAFQQAILMGQIQLMTAYQFLLTDYWSYLSRAFQFNRQFEYKWTVNWRFMDEKVFLSKELSYGLLGLHVILLLIFLDTRWLPVPTGGAIDMIAQPPKGKEKERIARRVQPESVLTTILTSMIIGCLCARTLHYQFYAYIFWSTPFLLWRSGLHPLLIYAVFMAQEWSWNVYPSTNASSEVVVGCLAFTMLSIWAGAKREPLEDVKKVQ